MLFLLTLSATFVTPTAQASGYMAPDSGIVAASRGGAFIASAEGQFAQYYNPAGLIHSTGQSFNFGITGMKKNVSFQPTATGSLDYRVTNDEVFGYSYDKQTNQGAIMPIPEFGYIRQISDSVVFAVGLTSPTAPNLSYDKNGAGRYGLVGLTIVNASFGPSVAWRVAPWLTLGAGAQAQSLSIHESIVISTYGSDITNADIYVDANVKDVFASSYNLGMLINPTRWLTLGASYQPGVRFLAKGGLSLDLTGNSYEIIVDDPLLTDDSVAIAINLPTVIRGGLMVAPTDRTDFEIAVVYERWSELSEITLSNIDISLTPDIAAPDEIALPSTLQDTFSVRLGGQHALSEQLSVRGGGLVESSAVATSDLTLSMTDLPKLMLASGASYTLANARWRFDVAATHTFYQTTEVTESTATIVNLLDPDGASDPFGDGIYSASATTIGAGMTFFFGGPV